MQETMAAQEEKYFSNDVDDQHESSEGNISVVCEFCGKNIEKLKYKRHLRNVHTEKRSTTIKYILFNHFHYSILIYLFTYSGSLQNMW